MHAFYRLQVCYYTLCLYTYIDAPRIAIDPTQSPHTVNVGERLILYCTAEGFPIPTIQWYKNNVPILQKPPQSYLAASTNTPGTTVYTCEGKNNAGNMKNTANANITVIVKSMYVYSTLTNNYNFTSVH